MNKYDTYNPTIAEPEEGLQEDGMTLVADGGVIEALPEETVVKKTAKKRKSKPRQAETKRASTATNQNGISGVERLSAFLTSQTCRWLVATALFFLATYLTISFVSYVFTMFADQSEIANTAIGTSKGITNAGGEGGARISSFLIDDCFGISSCVIMFWLFAISLKLYGSKIRFKTVNFTIKCLVALIAVSLIIGLTTIAVDSPLNLGGAHGRYVNLFIIEFTGWAGAVMAAAFFCAVFVILCMRDLILWIIKIRKQALERRAAIEAEKEAQRQKEKEMAEIARKEKEELERMEANPDGIAPASENAESESGSAAVAVDTVSFKDTTLPLTEEYCINDEDEPMEEEERKTVIGQETASLSEDSPAPVESKNDEKGEDIIEEPLEDSIEEPVDAVDKEKGRSMLVKVNTIGEVAKGKYPVNGPIPGSTPYKFPPYSLMKEISEQVTINPEEQRQNEEKIRETLASFNINITSITATVGPTVTLYEIVPDKGVKIASIRNLVDDISLSLAAKGVRIIAPIPGKGTVGIEVANKNPQTVSMRTILKSQKFQETKAKLPVALGATISNEVYIADLAKMPHLLVAGATGQGKSVGMNAIITSLLYSKSPAELKLVMIDPKCVEFSFYSKIEKQYLAELPDEVDPIITDMSKVVPLLNSLCIEMDNRYQLLKNAHCKNLDEYNPKILRGDLNPDEGHKFLPYIVVMVDEFSDLMMMAGKEVEIPVARLAQKARAVGMHVIIATQRPSTDVITGLIKANFPARIAFRVTNGIDSRTILNSTSAYSLIGRGDMLVSYNSELVRVQCAFIDTPEVEAICDYISQQHWTGGPYILPEPPQPEGSSLGGARGNNVGERDPLFDEIARMVVGSNTASTSSLQRRYSIGYARAGKIMDQLEAAGIVGPSHDGKPRNVLIDEIALEQILG